MTDTPPATASIEPDNNAGAPAAVVTALQLEWISWKADNGYLEPDHRPYHVLANLRHNCAAQRGVSKALDLKEIYITINFLADKTNSAADPVLAAAFEKDGHLYALLARAGTCKKCGATAASLTGRIVRRDSRPPITGRSGRYDGE
jgi:hypothetical protein